MTYDSNLNYLRNLRDNTEDALSARCWAVFFKDTNTGNYLCYDGPDPVKTFQAVSRSHPNYTFAGARACDSQATVVEYAKALRLCAKLLPMIKKSEELLNTAA